ncbi:MAG: hypothetical protein WC640_00685 [Candidatus Paceibacterota bacterium]|jgi:hypothetical protein
MTKKIIIAILIVLIIASLGMIGYIVVSQNTDLNFLKFWQSGTATNNQTPKIPANFFPEATGTINANLSNLASDTINSLAVGNGISENPTLAGASALGLTVVNNNKTEQVFFVDRQSGNIYEITPQNELLRLTGETLSNVQEVYWGKDKVGERIIIRRTQLNQPVTLSGSIKYSTSTNLGTLNSQMLSVNISSLAISPDGSKFFTLEPTVNGTVGYINDWTGKNKKKTWSFPFSDWQITWPKANIISLQTRASANDLGYLYFLDLNTGNFTKILSGVPGLTAKVSPDGQKIIFSRSSLGKFELYSYDAASKKISLSGVNTLPEKCTWADNDIFYCAVPRSIPSSLYPDNWYQGKTAFTDDIWKIDLKQKTTVLLIPIKSSYDLVNLVIAPKRGWLYAINKLDNSIQSFSLPQ